MMKKYIALTSLVALTVLIAVLTFLNNPEEKILPTDCRAILNTQVVGTTYDGSKQVYFSSGTKVGVVVVDIFDKYLYWEEDFDQSKWMDPESWVAEYVYQVYLQPNEGILLLKLDNPKMVSILDNCPIRVYDHTRKAKK